MGIDSVIKFSGATLGYDRFVALENFNLDLKAGELVSFFGPSGSGKSTIVKAILGIINPIKGTVKIHDILSSDYSKKIGYVPQDNQLLPWLTIEENISLWQRESQGSPFSTRMLLELVRMDDRAKFLPSEVSGGMARRTALARGLGLKSDILCLDEGMVGVERSFRKDLMVAIRTHLKEHHITTVMISHDYEEAVFMSDKIYVLSPGPAEIINVIDTNANGMPGNRTYDTFGSEAFNISAHQLIN